MSQAVEPDGNAPMNYEPDVDLLLRLAGKVDIGTERESETESWTRGKSKAGDAIVEDRGPTGVAVVQLPGGDSHGTLLIEGAGSNGGDAGPFAGACDCDGFVKHKKPCAHLVCRAVRSILRDGEVPENANRYNQLVASNGPDQRDDPEASDDESEQLSDVGGLDPVASRAGDEDVVDVEPADANVAMPNTAGDPFAAELRENVPERYVMQLGGEPYIRRAGFAAIARQAGLGVEVEAVTPAEETDFQHARYVATVRDSEGNILGKDVGTARLEFEDLSGAEAQLDELAATRACRRAIEWATGAGATLRRDV